MFHPMTGAPHPVSLTIRAPSGIGLAAGRLREVASGLDPQLRVGRLRSLDEMSWQRRSFDHMFGFMLGAVMADRAPLLDGRHLHPHGLHRRPAVA